MQPPTQSSTSSLAGTRCRVLSKVLLALSFAYALAATAMSPHHLSLIDAATVFWAGAVPGLLVTLLRWMARPGTFRRPVRQIMVGSTLAGAALVAAAPYLIVG